MKYRALFIGGPLDGQERVLTVCPVQINVAARLVPTVQYNLLLLFGMTAVYSASGVEETLEHVWYQYTRGQYA